TGLWQFFTDKERMLQFIESMGVWDEVVFILLQALQVIVAPIPGEVLNVIGGYLYGTISGVVWSTIGTTIGSYVAFVLSRKLGRPFVVKFVDRFTLKRFDYILHHKGAFIVFMLFLIPGFPKDYLCYILGLGHLSTIEFLSIAGIGRLLGTVLETLGGDYIRHNRYQELFVLVGAALLVIFITMIFRSKIERLLRKVHIIQYKKKKRKKERRASHNQQGIIQKNHPLL
ncbi:MAG TPA: TVP38/TMEM64 family protein, partial [Thermodesulfovibrionales bacterium]|nr:TVP38/TMEM64 family protein [Thermodesulfovibrionales bacterium]